MVPPKCKYRIRHCLWLTSASLAWHLILSLSLHPHTHTLSLWKTRSVGKNSFQLYAIDWIVPVPPYVSAVTFVKIWVVEVVNHISAKPPVCFMFLVCNLSTLCYVHQKVNTFGACLTKQKFREIHNKFVIDEWWKLK